MEYGLDGMDLDVEDSGAGEEVQVEPSGDAVVDDDDAAVAAADDDDGYDDDDDDDDDNGDDDDELYIMVKCVCVCHEKVTKFV